MYFTYHPMLSLFFLYFFLSPPFLLLSFFPFLSMHSSFFILPGFLSLSLPPVCFSLLSFHPGRFKHFKYLPGSATIIQLFEPFFIDRIITEVFVIFQLCLSLLVYLYTPIHTSTRVSSSLGHMVLAGQQQQCT